VVPVVVEESEVVVSVVPEDMVVLVDSDVVLAVVLEVSVFVDTVVV
jgi:hypothetical protein